MLNSLPNTRTKSNTRKRNGIEITVYLEDSDLGKVIGKQGKIAKALRTLVKAATPKDSKKYSVEIKGKEVAAE